MGRKKLPAHKQLKHVVCVRLDNEKYQELEKILRHPPQYGMSDLLRRILENRRIKIFVSDPAIDPLLQELREIRAKIKRAGIEINQYTKNFHSFPGLGQKQFYAKLVFQRYAGLASLFDRLTEISQLFGKRWLSENFGE